MNNAPADLNGPVTTRVMPTVNMRLALVMVVVVLLIDQVIAFYAVRLATYSSGWFAPFLNRVDPDHAFSWLCLHHVALLLLTLPVLVVWRSIPLRRRGFNLDQWQTSLRWFGWFALYCTLGVLLFGVGPHLLRGTAPQFDFPLNTNEWQLTLDVAPAEREINFCFTDGSRWDNNYTGDWRVRRR